MTVIHSHFFEAMASRCEIRLAAADESASQALAKCAMNEVRRIEAKYSRYQPSSVVSRINAQAGQEWVTCDFETLALLDFANTLFDTSGGLFDITSGVLRRAWNFRQARVPTQDLLQELCELVDWRSVQREGQCVRLPWEGMELDFGGFGKEYAADCAAAVLLGQGVRHGYVNLAGDIRVLGPQPQGQPWVIGIQHPRDNKRLIASIAVSSGAIATSGDYERFFELAGQRYCHILRPRSGLPVGHWRSVSVQAASALQAGSLATVAMLKEAQALAFLAQQNVSYLAVDQQGGMHYKEAIDTKNVIADPGSWSGAGPIRNPVKSEDMDAGS